MPTDKANKGSKSSEGTRARSAITGRFVAKDTARRHPRTTVQEQVKK
jgi:hypothetical protein